LTTEKEPSPTKFYLSVTKGATESAFTWPKNERERRKKGVDGVSRNNYIFDRVPPDELAACVHYEYARESARIVEAVTSLRQQFLESTRKASTGDSINASFRTIKFTRNQTWAYDSWFLLGLADGTGFPALAWMDLEVEDRRKLTGLRTRAVEMHNREFVKEHPVFMAQITQETPELPGITLATWEAETMPKAYLKLSADDRRPWLLSGFLMVNLLHSPEEIVRTFTKWLTERHPRGNKPKPEKRGRNSYRDRLRALGALRLRFYCRTLHDAQTKGGLRYSDRRACNRACALASDYYRAVFDLPKTEFPLHFTNGW